MAKNKSVFYAEEKYPNPKDYPMNCPRCQSDQYVKNGMLRGRQRYLCKPCKYQFTVERRSCDATPETKEMAIKMYLEGLGIRAIGRVINFSNVTVLSWIKKFAAAQQVNINEENSIPVMELDEMHSYVGSKKSLFGYGFASIDEAKSS
jgi:transposase